MLILLFRQVDGADFRHKESFAQSQKVKKKKTEKRIGKKKKKKQEWE